MKSIVIAFIVVYQKIISLTLKNLLGVGAFCRFTPTCSEYARRSIYENGIFIGGYQSLVRLFKCQPFYNQSNNHERS